MTAALRRRTTLVVGAACLLPLSLVAGFVSAPAARADGGCLPYSTLSCDQVAPALPFTDEFTTNTGTYGGTGFTMVQPSTSGTFQPGRVAVDTSGSGTLTVTTTAGTNFAKPPTKNANALDDGLGVGVDAVDEKLSISTVLTSIPATANAGEAFGLWFGPDQDDYVRLVLSAAGGGKMKPQLLRESGGVSGKSDQLNGASRPYAGHVVALTLTTDPGAATVTGSYSRDGGASTSLGTLAVPATFFDGSTLSGQVPHATSFTGLIASHGRNPTGTGLSLGIGSFGVVGTDLGPPAAPTGVTAVVDGNNDVDVAWNPNQEKDLAGYEVFRSTTTPVDTLGPALSGGAPLTDPTFVDTTAAASTTYYYSVVAVDQTRNVSPASAPASVSTRAPPAPSFSLSNLDGQPTPNRLVMNQIGSPADSNQHTHRSATVRLTNTGQLAASVDGIAVTGPYTASPSLTLPTTLQPGQSLDVTATEAASSAGIQTGQLAVSAGGTEYDVALEGWWQQHSEDHDEPLVPDIVSLFGYGTQVPSTMNEIGAFAAATPDEVLIHDWRRADTSMPVSIQELATFHTYPSSGSVSYYAKGSGSTLHPLMTTTKYDAQSFFPRRSSVTGAPASTTFTPGGAFGLKIDNEYEDPILNSDATDRKKGCHAAVCGYHVRAFRLRDASGALVPNSYLLFEDDGGVNYDFQDNVYLVSNIQPEEATGTPATPTATPGEASVSLTWPPVSGGDVQGYNVYRDTSSTVTTASTLVTATPVTTPSLTDTGLTDGTSYSYAVQTVYADGTTSGLSPVASAVPANPNAPQLHVDFTSPTGALAAGYLRDDGQAFGPRSGPDQGGATYGWVVPGTSTPLDLSVGGSGPGNGRVRGVLSDQKADSILYMQAPDSAQPFNGTNARGSWVAQLPNGTYRITVAAGDPTTSSSAETDQLTVNGAVVLGPFTPSGKTGSSTRETVATATVTVTGGLLTVDATGGTNTKIAYLDAVQLS